MATFNPRGLKKNQSKIRTFSWILQFWTLLLAVKGQFLSFPDITSVAMKTALEKKIKNQTSPMLIIPLLAHRSISLRFLVFRSAEKTIAFKTTDNLFGIFSKLITFYNLGKKDQGRSFLLPNIFSLRTFPVFLHYQAQTRIRWLLKWNTLDIQLLNNQPLHFHSLFETNAI